MEHQIDCIEKDDRNDPSTSIKWIGGRNADGSRWRITQREAIDGIKSGKWTFCVHIGIQRVRVLVATSRYGNEYIKTENDGSETNNLLSLADCRYAA